MEEKEETEPMRRLFVVRKDLSLSPGKLAAMVGHMAEAYWTDLLKASPDADVDPEVDWAQDENRTVTVPRGVWDGYVAGIFTKTICECRNLRHLRQAAEAAAAEGLVEGEDWGYINDCCRTELKPENPDGTCTVGIWFKPLPDSVARSISKKFKLYGAFDARRNCDAYGAYEKAYTAYASLKGNPHEDPLGFCRWLFEPYAE